MRDAVPVNVTVPAVDAERAHEIVRAGGCRTAKVKVAEPGQTLADDEARLEAVRDAIGPTGGSGSTPTAPGTSTDAVAAIAALDRAAGGLEYVEQPCAAVEDLAVVRRRVDVPIAADESIRRAADPYRVRDLEAADIAVLKVQPLGGVRACLRIAEDIGLPVVVSSALETSVGHRGRRGARRGAAGAAVRVRAGHRAAAHRRRRGRPAAAGRRRCCPCGAPRSTRPRWPGWPRRRTGSRTGRRGWPRCGRIGRRDRHQPRPPAWSTHCSRAGVTEIVIAPGSRNAPLSFAAHDAAAAGLVRLHTRIDERTAGFLALGLTKVGARAAVICTSGTAVANLHPAVLEAAHAGLPLVVVTADRPARLRGTGANQTTDQVGIFGPLVPHASTSDETAGLTDVVEQRRGRLHLNVQLDEPLVPDDTWDVRRERTDWSRPSRRTAARGCPIDLGPSAISGRAADGGGGRRRRRTAGADVRRTRRTGRCSPSRAAAPATAPTRCAATGCCSTPSSVGSIERVVVFGHPTLSRPVTRLLNRADVEVARDTRAGRVGGAAVPVHAHRRADRGARRPGVARPVARGRPRRLARASTRCSPPRPT